jgi:hypothetical protein
VRTTLLAAIFIGPALVAGPITVTETPGPPFTIGSGGHLTDSALLAGGIAPTGSLTFTLNFGGIVDTETVPVSGNGTYTTPVGYTPFQVGTYTWTALYNGDTNNSPASDTGKTQVVNQATPGISTVPGGPVAQGSFKPLLDTAILSGGFNETGTLVFMLRDPSSVVVDTETVPVNGNGTYTTPVGFVASVAGTYQWTASYSGDVNNTAANSPFGSEPQMVTPEPGSAGMLLTGLAAGCLGLYRRRSRTPAEAGSAS